MRNIHGKTALVTGAASGIGRETALALARAGAVLIICDMNPEGLAAVAEEINSVGECRLAEAVDVSSRDAMAAFAEKVHDIVPALDILVNNAGVGLAGGFLDTSLDDMDWLISINLKGVIHGMYYFLPRMVNRAEEAHVVNVASLAGYWVGAGLTGYTMTKFGVFGLTEAMRADLRMAGHTHVGVSTICPGVIRTGIIQSSRIRMSGDTEALRQRIEAQYKQRNYGPELVARAILKAIKQNRNITPVSPESWTMYYLNRACVPLSRWIAHQTVKKMMG